MPTRTDIHKVMIIGSGPIVIGQACEFDDAILFKRPAFCQFRAQVEAGLAAQIGKERVRALFLDLGIEMPRSAPAYSVEEAERIASQLGYPVVIRPAYTLGGTGGGLVYNVEELDVVASRGLAASIVGQILVEESVLGWEELELEVVRDAKN